MTQAFDTVDDIRTWLDEEEPSEDEAQEALEIERDGDNRTTGKMALNEYLDSFEDEEEPEEDDEGQEYVVMRPFAGHGRGDRITRDPDEPQTETYLRDGRIQRR